MRLTLPAILFMAFFMPVFAHADADTASTEAFKAANNKMHDHMMITYSGNADADFVSGMLPHHQGAIDMAKVELQYGKDPELKKLAKDIIAAQTGEINMMQDWQKRRGK